MADPKRVKMMQDDLSKLCVNTIRVLAADTVQKASSGHPGAPMGCAPMAHALWSAVMNYNPSNPRWFNRDRFVLSNGHACALQYCMLHLTGYDMTMDDLKSFRQVESRTPGHPENHLTEGIEVSTGPLGQGLSNAVGLALAEKHLAATFNRPGFDMVDHHTFVICGDGCLQEGVSAEASSLAGHLRLGKLIVLYDDNQITIDGETELSFGEDVLKRYEAYGWHVSSVSKGDSTDPAELLKAIEDAKAVTDKPSIIKVRTVIGIGSQNQGTEKVHGSPLGDEDLAQVKKLYGFDPEASFVVSDEVYEFYKKRADLGREAAANWDKLLAEYRSKFPELAADFERRMKGDLPEGWEKELPAYTSESKAEATRKYSMFTLEKLVPTLPELVGGSADLTPSNLTKVKGNDLDFSHKHPEGRYIRFGVREHAMAAVCNGMAAHGGIIPFGATFLVFTGYAFGAVRLSALSHFRVIYVMTHDSIGLGEDGPTHQPVETLASARAIPNLLVIRPADGNETSGAYKAALLQSSTPSILSLSRQGCANIAGTSIDGVLKGAYVVRNADPPSIILTATGSELQLVMQAVDDLEADGHKVRVVSFPCWELFEQQSQEYKESIFPDGVPVLSVEAGAATGWERYSHGQVCMSSFGHSGPGGEVMKYFGFNKQNVVEKAKKLAEFYAGGKAQSRVMKPF
ncbi:uncharacterized protein MONBRDRAFT_20362 [Monosiga brevicollis MX1]|uniref:Transketolase n=1 Tax=Monosiga brevicollis TaxID=81824 RepID=A9UUK8_MONBE|nr:uncharacterized protein MONBRDRAFT_20362 [Monosiga brevicollis MX1]EDQ91115.1 predicted protein [Monosiga brevicollis MX1]|eukprot:XP_001744412.1 hypothetical protein [Monosiga brevicollis MX1]